MLTERERARLGRALMTDIPDAVIFADRDGVIRHWNAGAARIFGYSAEEANGRSLDIIIPPNLRGRHWDGFHHTMNTGESRYGPSDVLAVPACTKSGSTISIQFTVAIVHDENDARIGIVAVLRDVTRDYLELKRLRAKSVRKGPDVSPS